MRSSSNFFVIIAAGLVAACDTPTEPDHRELPFLLGSRASGALDDVDLSSWDANGNGLVCVKRVPASGNASPNAGERTIVKDDDGDGVCPGGFEAERVALAVAITAGQKHACMVDADGAAWCWGDNAEGQLGTAAVSESSVPVAVDTDQRFTAIQSARLHTCGLAAGGVVYCWGSNRAGQLGDGTTASRAAPGPVVGSETFVALDAGSGHTCAVTAADVAYCWGANDWWRNGRFGGLGRTTSEICLDIATDEPIPCGRSPQPVDTPLRFKSVSAGLLSTCGMATDGAAYCWGWDQWDQGGDGMQVTGPVPTPVATPPDLVTVVAGVVTGCGLDPVGAAYCWGTFPLGFGQAGNGNLLGEPTPDAVVGGHAFTWVGNSDANNIFQFTCGIDKDGDAWCWGSNSFGQLGTDAGLPLTCPAFGGRSPDCTAEPVAVGGGLTWEAIDMDSEYACGLAAGGVPYCWGNNSWGNLGDGTKTNHTIPAPVLFP